MAGNSVRLVWIHSLTRWKADLAGVRSVDVPIHLYSLYSHLNPAFSSKWSSGEEVLACASNLDAALSQRCGDAVTDCYLWHLDWKGIASKHNLLDKIVFRTDFVSSHWNAATQHHDIQLRNCDTDNVFQITAQVLISATGALNKPIVPKLPGIDTFKGLQWHSSRWNNEVDLSGKRIAIVGSGSSGIQSIPYISKLPGIEITQL